jgi:hypothetical protein
MATKAEIKDAILKIANYPESGAIAELADSMAEAVFAIDNPPSLLKGVEKESRVTKPAELR